jgi:hypothetical protein
MAIIVIIRLGSSVVLGLFLALFATTVTALLCTATFFSEPVKPVDLLSAIIAEIFLAPAALLISLNRPGKDFLCIKLGLRPIVDVMNQFRLLVPGLI